jgi:HSP20 family molecular chaperone IbpA
MPIFRFKQASIEESASVAAALFWYSPWSVVSQWWDPEQNGQPVARTYRDGHRVIVEIEMAGVDPAQVELQAGANRLHLTYPDHQSTIPLPFFINEDTAKADWAQGLLRVVVEQQGLAGAHDLDHLTGPKA